MSRTIHSPQALTIDGFLDEDSCRQLIEQAELRGFEPAGVGSRGSLKALRDNDRILDDDPERAAWLWELLSPQLPEDLLRRDCMRRGAIGWHRACGLNPRFRWYRYDRGQRFTPHVDGSFRRPEDGAMSLFTVLLYLNDVARGGATRVELGRGLGAIQIQPRAGRLLVFDHQLLHEGQPIEEGRKYVLRTDIMYLPDT